MVFQDRVCVMGDPLRLDSWISSYRRSARTAGDSSVYGVRDGWCNSLVEDLDMVDECYKTWAASVRYNWQRRNPLVAVMMERG